MIRAIVIFNMFAGLVSIVCGIAILAGWLDLAAMVGLPAAFNKTSPIILILTGAGLIVAPYLPKKS